MDWGAIVGFVTAGAAVAGTTWAIISDRSKVRLLERVLDMEKTAPAGTASRESLSELRDRLSADLLQAYKTTNYKAWVGWGFGLITVSMVVWVIGALIEVDAKKFPFRPDSWGAWLPLIMITFALFLAGYAMFLYGLRLRLRSRRRERYDQFLAENIKRIEAAARRRWWNPWTRRRARELRRELETERATRPAGAIVRDPRSDRGGR